MKASIISVLLTLCCISQAATVKVFCLSQNPKGAIYLELNTTQGQSFGRMSTPFTADLNVLKSKNPKKDQFNKLNVGYVEKTSYGFMFNATPYQLVNHPEVIKLTKSHLYLDRAPAVLEMFEDQGNIVLNCEIVK